MRSIKLLALLSLVVSCTVPDKFLAEDGGNPPDPDASMIDADTTDTVAPVAGTDPVFSALTATSVTVSWGAATDDVTSAAELRYKVVRANTAGAIDSLAEVAAITSGAGLVMDFTANTLTVDVSGLSAATTYAFAVVVADAADNQALYTPAMVTTLDASAPTVGTGITFSGIAATSVTVNWGLATDDVTPQASLQYKVVRAATTGAIDSLAEVAAITTAPGLVLDFTTNVTTTGAAGLTSSTNYAFAVVVRDATGNEALYTPATVTTLDVTPPTTGTAISFTSIASTSVTVNWGAATDDITAQAGLQYKVVRAASAGAIDSLGEVAAITTAPGLVLDFTANTTSTSATGLTSSTTYAFAVVVRDAAGNTALYTPATVTTLDVTPPTTGAAISFTSISTTSVTVNWGAATDNVTPQANLQYKVVRAATTAAIDTLAEVAAITAAPGLVLDFTANTTSTSATGLTANTTYAFAVVVRDAAGNTALYTPATVTTVATCTGTTTFNYTGAVQTFTVPACATTVSITARGASGGNGLSDAPGGQGGVATGNLAVTGGSVLTVIVGGAGANTSGGDAGVAGSFGGGGSGGASGQGGAGQPGGAAGGGASDVRQGGGALANRRIVAAGGGGGGGGCGGGCPANGGAGGGATGGDGVSYSNGITFEAFGGTQTAGGRNGTYVSGGIPTMEGTAGSSGQGGNGDGGGAFSGGGGGGGGYFGGGGGSCHFESGGGGGSSYIGGVTSGTTTMGGNTGNGSVVISW